MIDTTVGLSRNDQPYLYYVGDGLLSPENLKALNANIPDREVYTREIKRGPQHRKEYNMWRCEPARDGVRTEDADRLTEPWSELVNSALSEDRKSTRLNSSHVEISYAVFCLKKKKEQK